MGAVMITYSPDVASWDGCVKAANVTCSGGSGTASGGRRLVDSTIAALKSKDSDHLKAWAQETFAGQKQNRRLMDVKTGSSACGTDSKVCSVKTSTKAVSCKSPQACSPGTNAWMCGAAVTDDDSCFADAIAKASNRGFSDGCCETACGTFNELVEAECSATGGIFEEKCTCKMKSSFDYGLCAETKSSFYKKTEVKTAAGVKIGSTSCKWSDDSGSSGTSTVSTACSAQTCKEWATNCMDQFFCPASRDAQIAVTNEGYAMLRMIVMIGSLVIIVGMLPICIGGTGKALGNDNIGNICGGIGCCSSVLFTGCGGTIMIFLPFIFGAVLTSVCQEIKTLNDDIHGTCASDGLGDCGKAMTSDVEDLCAVGSGLFASSVTQIIAQVFGLVAVVFTMVGWCQHRQNPQPVVTVNAQPVVVTKA